MKWLSLMACALDSNAVGEIMNTSLVDCARGGGAIVAAAPRVGSHARRRLRTFSSPLSSSQACPRKVQERAKWQVGENAFDEDVDSGVPMLRCRSTSHQPKCPLDFRQIFRLNFRIFYRISENSIENQKIRIRKFDCYRMQEKK